MKTIRKLMLLVAVLAMASFATASVITWDFAGGPQGWTDYYGGAPTWAGDAQSGYIYHQIETGSGSQCGVKISGLNEEILSSNDYLDLSVFLYTLNSPVYSNSRVEVTTIESGLIVIPLEMTPAVLLTEQLNLVDDVGLAVGNHITEIAFVTWGYSMLMGTSHVELNTSVPEPVTMSLLGVGGVIMVYIRRRRK